MIKKETHPISGEKTRNLKAIFGSLSMTPPSYLKITSDKCCLPSRLQTVVSLR